MENTASEKLNSKPEQITVKADDLPYAMALTQKQLIAKQKALYKEMEEESNNNLEKIINYKPNRRGLRGGRDLSPENIDRHYYFLKLVFDALSIDPKAPLSNIKLKFRLGSYCIHTLKEYNYIAPLRRGGFEWIVKNQKGELILPNRQMTRRFMEDERKTNHKYAKEYKAKKAREKELEEAKEIVERNNKVQEKKEMDSLLEAGKKMQRKNKKAGEKIVKVETPIEIETIKQKAKKAKKKHKQKIKKKIKKSLEQKMMKKMLKSMSKLLLKDAFKL